MKILLVEDEKKMASFIERGLKEEGFVVDAAYDGEKGADYAFSNDYDLLILDVMLPKLSGIEICRQLREKGKTVPVLMLTARDTVEDKVQGLDAGADDYLTKPFAFDELLARIRALQRRPRTLEKETSLTAGSIKIDLLGRHVWVDAQEISLSQKEFLLLEYLVRKKGEVVSRAQIAEQVWDLHFDPMSNTIDVFINFLRKKIDAGREKSLIETVRGAGYRLAVE